MKRFSALLNSPWENTADGIRGTWVEDDTEYYIIAPYPLSDVLIDLQHNFYNNWLHYKAIEQEYFAIKKMYEFLGD